MHSGLGGSHTCGLRLISPKQVSPLARKLPTAYEAFDNRPDQEGPIPAGNKVEELQG